MAGAITAAGLHGVLYDKYLKGVTAAGLVPKAKASVADLSSDHTGKAIVGLGVAGALVGMLMSVERLSGVRHAVPASFARPDPLAPGVVWDDDRLAAAPVD